MLLPDVEDRRRNGRLQRCWTGAHALSGRILRGEPHAAEDYLGFLRSGSSLYPLDVLRKAGVDLASPKPIEETFAMMEGYIDRLEKLLQ